MNRKFTSLTLSALLAFSITGTTSLLAQDAPKGRPEGRPGFPMRGPGFDSLSQEEKDKLKAASEKAMQDPKVKEAREKAETAMKEMRETMRAAQLAADPTVEPILKKLDEAREKAMKERGARPEQK